MCPGRAWDDILTAVKTEEHQEQDVPAAETHQERLERILADVAMALTTTTPGESARQVLEQHGIHLPQRPAQSFDDVEGRGDAITDATLVELERHSVQHDGGPVPWEIADAVGHAAVEAALEDDGLKARGVEYGARVQVRTAVFGTPISEEDEDWQQPDHSA